MPVKCNKFNTDILDNCPKCNWHFGALHVEIPKNSDILEEHSSSSLTYSCYIAAIEGLLEVNFCILAVYPDLVLYQTKKLHL